MRTILSMVFAGLALAAVAGCGEDERGSDGKLRIVTSTTYVADLARNVAGEHAEVEAIMPPNADPHDYEPRPADAEALIDADLIITSGGGLDLWMDELADAAGTDATRISLFSAADAIPVADGHGGDDDHGGHGGDADLDPHWWHDPDLVRQAVTGIRERLIALAPEGERAYRANVRRYDARVAALDRRIAACFERIPPERRKLVTTHDSLAYFAQHYGLEVVGAALPALTTQAQPSAAQVADLVDLIREEGVPAVFVEAGMSPDLERAIADEAGVRLGGELWTDGLGPEGSGAETYLDALAANARTIAAGLGARECGI